MRRKFKAATKYLIFLSVGVVIFWYLYKDQDISRMKSVLRNDVAYLWIWISVILGVFSHISRAVRWRILIEPLGHKPRLTNTFFAVMIGYIMNLVIPRMGELSKCGVLTKYENISFARLIGTMVTERIFDLLMLGLITLIMIITQFGQVMSFLDTNPEVREKSYGLLTSPFLISGGLALLFFLILFRRRFRKSALYRKTEKIAAHFKEGILSVRYIRNKGSFIFHTIFIWTMYYLMLYISFFAFDFTSGLSPLAGLTTFVLASFGMAAPVQGGIGAWHFMTRESLALYGIPYENGIIFAFLAHGIMTLMIIVLGILSFVALPFFNNRSRGKIPVS